MKKDMINSPELVLTDGTYKLFKRKFSLQVFMVVDKYGQSKIVGIGILANEKKPNVKWLFRAFKLAHGDEVCKSIKSFMTDKDLTERLVIADVFDHVKLLLCQFHTKQTFETALKSKDLSLTPARQAPYLELMYEMCESRTEKKYKEIYKEFKNLTIKNGDEKVLLYFDKNWDEDIRNQWTTFGMNQAVHLGNLTNNRVESNNSKLKKPEWLKPNDTMVNAIKNLFRWMKDRGENMRYLKGQEHVKRNAIPDPEGSIESKYREVLTRYAFNNVQWSIKFYPEVDLQVKNVMGQECIAFEIEGDVLATPFNCTCSKWNARLFVCKHILAVRSYFKLPMFTLELCTRWVKSPMKKSQLKLEKISQKPVIKLQRLMMPKNLSTNQKISEISNVLNEIFYMVRGGPNKKINDWFEELNNIAGNFPQENSEISFAAASRYKKKEILKILVDNLKKKISLSPQIEFDVMYNSLQEILNNWKQNKRSSVLHQINKTSMNNSDKNIEDLSAVEEEEEKIVDDDNTDILTLKLPPQVKIIGGQRRSDLRCTKPLKCVAKKKINY